VGTGPAGTRLMISWIPIRVTVLKGAATSTPTG
jgi:hypothetical protein